jgi:predicted GNAT superfamily acetyltransferase
MDVLGTEPLTLRPLADADCAGVLRINAGNRPAVAALDRAEFERLRGLSNAHLAAVAGERVLVAYMLVFENRCAYDGEEFQYFRAHLGAPFLYVDQVAVDPRHTRSGVGTQLYGALFELARARGIGALCCEVNTAPPNPASLEFHRRLGFAAIGNGDTLDGRRVTFLLRKV